MYRTTKRADAARVQLGARARQRGHAAGPAPAYPVDLPNLRRTVIVIDRDCGLRVTRLDLWRTSRVDSYMVHVDGTPWRRMGWSRLLEALRVSHVRVASPRSG